jgi:hypothetical protein
MNSIRPKQWIGILCGALMFFGALWGGAWGWQFIEAGKDEAFAIAMIATQIALVVAGIVIAAFSAGAE